MRYLILALLLILFGGCQVRLFNSIVEYTEVSDVKGEHPILRMGIPYIGIIKMNIMRL